MAAEAAATPRSIRHTLWLYLGGLMALFAVALLFGARDYGQRAANRSYDHLLVSSALSIIDSVALVEAQWQVDLPYAALDLLAMAPEDRVFYRVSDAHDRTVTGYDDLPAAPRTPSDRPQLFDAPYSGETVRFVVVSRRVSSPSAQGEVRVQVGQTRRAREVLAQDMVTRALVAIVVLTALSIGFGWEVRTVGDMGALPDSLPTFLFPDVPLTWDTLRLLLPVSATLAVVGLLESMMTAQIVEDMTDTPSQRNRECAGQGLANITAGLFGGMGGCAMIGQSVINVSSGGRGRLSCLVAGVLLLLLVVYGAHWVRQIPMAALVAVMIMVSIGTFHWRSFQELRLHPKSSSLVMVATVVVTVITHDLAKGVLTGVLLSALFFARKVGRMLDVHAVAQADGSCTYTVAGQVFFASAGQFAASFDLQHVPARVVIDLSNAHFWDLSAVAALERVVARLRAHGAQVEVRGLNAASQTLVERLARTPGVDGLPPGGH
ncbi:MAG TPA: hypothetical protein DEB32_03810 [Stenotrophomonas sp.]|nr:hypothetical protein [Stenotrophomonas sp.]